MENQAKTEEHVTSQKNKELHGYMQFVMDVIKKPHSILSTDYKGYHSYGLITIIAFLSLIVIRSFSYQLKLHLQNDYIDTKFISSFQDFFAFFTTPLTLAAVLALIIVSFKWYAGEKEGKKLTTNYFLEKLGALLVPSAILYATSIPLALLDISVGSWLSSVAYTFLYVAIFLVSYLFVARDNLKVAAVFLFAFYMIDNVIGLIITL
ncbi:hypothetical protein ACFFIS_16615 [Virgibacillus soli]|uniref:Yip1 domain-containing protein n=1 Tax=Paracerasibacillus soli TaxID=480284 RepID=A0ABU5CVK0_9BACI|nr:hypothetical protein [Virgibacillus soli]MDY0410392.1 hypothetical protein [Virgibacillus soli]